MTKLLDDTLVQQVTDALGVIDRPVELLLFTASDLVVPGQDPPGEQRAARALLQEVAACHPDVELVERRVAIDDDARAWGISRAPTLVVRERGSDRHNVRFVGVPSGYEFQTLIEAIRLVGTATSGLPEEAVAALRALPAPVRLQSFVTPTCPYCPRAVVAGYRMAIETPQVVAEGVAANEFPTLSQRYRISGVPDTVIDGAAGQERVLGGQPERVFVEAVLKAAGVGASAAA
jgi:glutaredoxin-like protein